MKIRRARISWEEINCISQAESPGSAATSSGKKKIRKSVRRFGPFTRRFNHIAEREGAVRALRPHAAGLKSRKLENCGTIESGRCACRDRSRGSRDFAGG